MPEKKPITNDWEIGIIPSVREKGVVRKSSSYGGMTLLSAAVKLQTWGRNFTTLFLGKQRKW